MNRHKKQEDEASEISNAGSTKTKFYNGLGEQPVAPSGVVAREEAKALCSSYGPSPCVYAIEGTVVAFSWQKTTDSYTQAS